MASFGGSNSSGTISVANGSTAVTGGGAVDWADISERDMLFAGGHVGLIETFNAVAKTITLYDPWAGTTLVAAPYTILFSSPDRYDPTLNATRQQRLLDRLESATTFDLISDHGTDVASASTINLQATGVSNILDITGSTTINAVTLANGDFRFVRFVAAPLLVNSATLVLPGGANIQTAAGDMAIFVGYAAGVVRCLQFSRATGQALAASPITRKVGAASRDVALATGLQVITGVGFRPTAIFIIGNMNANQPMSFGFSDGSAHATVFDNHLYIPNTYGILTTSIMVVQGTPGDQQLVALNSFDSDGFTLSWFRIGAPFGTFSFSYLAMR